MSQRKAVHSAALAFYKTLKRIAKSCEHDESPWRTGVPGVARPIKHNPDCPTRLARLALGLPL